MFVMTTTNMNMKTQFNTLIGAANTLFARPQPRWRVWLASGFGLLVLAKIALAASQIFDILNATYAASLT